MTEQATNEATLHPHRHPGSSTEPGQSPCDEALISRQRQRYLVSLITDEEQRSDSRYREQ